MFLSMTSRNVQRRDQSFTAMTFLPTLLQDRRLWLPRLFAIVSAVLPHERIRPPICSCRLLLDCLPQDWIYCLSNDQRSTAEPSIADGFIHFPGSSTVISRLSGLTRHTDVSQQEADRVFLRVTGRLRPSTPCHVALHRILPVRLPLRRSDR
jgi:hypothetical protein